jgi:hypothetical protein
MNVKLPFPEFIETYLSAETVAHSRSIVPLVDGTDLLELYSYELLVYDEETDETTVVEHPDYMEAGIEAYTDFLLDMQRAFAEKKPS